MRKWFGIVLDAGRRTVKAAAEASPGERWKDQWRRLRTCLHSVYWKPPLSIDNCYRYGRQRGYIIAQSCKRTARSESWFFAWRLVDIQSPRLSNNFKLKHPGISGQDASKPASDSPPPRPILKPCGAEAHFRLCTCSFGCTDQVLIAFSYCCSPNLTLLASIHTNGRRRRRNRWMFRQKEKGDVVQTG